MPSGSLGADPKGQKAKTQTKSKPADQLIPFAGTASTGERRQRRGAPFGGRRGNGADALLPLRALLLQP